MAHDVEEMFSVREVPWHRLGHVLEDYPQTFEEARRLAGLDWDPEEEEVLTPAMSREQVRAAMTRIVLDAEMKPIDQVMALEDLFETAALPDPGFRRIVRSDTRATLSYQMDSYQVIPNSAFGEIIDAVVGQPNVKLETGGCLRGGRLVWMLARLDEPIAIPGDDTLTLPYLAMTSRHDGTGSAQLRATAIRVVCANTFEASEAEAARTGAAYSFVHRGDWRSRLGDAREAVTFARQRFHRYAEEATELLGIRVDARQTEIFVREFIPAPPVGMATERVLRNVEESRGKLRTLIASPTVEGAGVAGTAYGLMQAGGEYLDWARTARSWETRLSRSLLRFEPLKAKAAKLAREVANA